MDCNQSSDNSNNIESLLDIGYCKWAPLEVEIDEQESNHNAGHAQLA